MANVASDISGNADLARYMTEFCDGVYSQHEFKDMLDILCQAVDTAVMEGYRVRLGSLVTFKPHYVPGRVVDLRVNNKPAWWVDSHIKVKLELNKDLKNRLRWECAERIKTDPEFADRVSKIEYKAKTNND